MHASLRRRAAPLFAPRLMADLAVLALLFAMVPLSAASVPLIGPTAAAPLAAATLHDADPADICLRTADRAADRHGVPRAVLRALTRTETGRARGGALQPWAWTVNMEGAGHWFDTRAEALAYVAREQARGARSFDVGCFQINHRWHGENFASVAEMFDPDANADYAARFIRELYDETQSWPRAAGFYHSRTPEFFNRYSARFARILERGDEATGPVRLAALPGATGAPAPQRERDRARPIKRSPGFERPTPLIWRAAEAPPVSAGAVSIRVLRGGMAPLAGAARPLID